MVKKPYMGAKVVDKPVSGRVAIRLGNNHVVYIPAPCPPWRPVAGKVLLRMLRSEEVTWVELPERSRLAINMTAATIQHGWWEVIRVGAPRFHRFGKKRRTLDDPVIEPGALVYTASYQQDPRNLREWEGEHYYIMNTRDIPAIGIR